MEEQPPEWPLSPPSTWIFVIDRTGKFFFFNLVEIFAPFCLIRNNKSCRENVKV